MWSSGHSPAIPDSFVSLFPRERPQAASRKAGDSPNRGGTLLVLRSWYTRPQDKSVRMNTSCWRRISWESRCSVWASSCWHRATHLRGMRSRHSGPTQTLRGRGLMAIRCQASSRLRSTIRPAQPVRGSPVGGPTTGRPSGGAIAKTPEEGPREINGFHFVPGWMLLHPGPRDQKATLRFTAPSDCQVLVTAHFGGTHATTRQTCIWYKHDRTLQCDDPRRDRLGTSRAHASSGRFLYSAARLAHRRDTRSIGRIRWGRVLVRLHGGSTHADTSRRETATCDGCHPVFYGATRRMPREYLVGWSRDHRGDGRGW